MPLPWTSDAVCLAGQAVMVQLGVHGTSNCEVQEGRRKLGLPGSVGEDEQGLQVPRRTWTPQLWSCIPALLSHGVGRRLG